MQKAAISITFNKVLLILNCILSTHNNEADITTILDETIINIVYNMISINDKLAVTPSIKRKIATIGVTIRVISHHNKYFGKFFKKF